MIEGKQALFQRIRAYNFCLAASALFADKVRLLDAAISQAVSAIGVAQSSRVHLAYSGGVDSSVVLLRLLQGEHPVTAHTMGVKANHPDVVYATAFIKRLKEQGLAIEHVVHIVTPSEQDTQESNRLLGARHRTPDNYYMLMKVLKPHTTEVVCCDCIDELLGGYHMHRDPRGFFPHYDAEVSDRDNRIKALEHYMAALIPDHLSILDKFSAHFGVTVHLPYGDTAVMEAANAFGVSELVDAEGRKKPIYAIAEALNVPSDILARRKYGLVSAFHDVSV